MTFRLGDNDFGTEMRNAAKHLAENFPDELKTCALLRFKAAMVHFMAGEHAAKDVLWGRCNEEDCPAEVGRLADYFSGAKVCRSGQAPAEDTDGGSVSIDTATNYVWTH
jgi:hypothetical protein